MWCWCPEVVARVGPGTEQDSAWLVWHSAVAPFEGAAGWPTGEKMFLFCYDPYRSAY